MLDKLFSIAEKFKSAGNVIDVEEFGNGNINNTYLVTLDEKKKKHFILQRINTLVFSQPELVILNMRICADHINRRLQSEHPGIGRRWEVPEVLLAKNGLDHYVNHDGSFWRAISFIENAKPFSIIKNIHHANEVGYALGIFHVLLNDLSPENLFDTLEGFHITPCYLRRYESIIARYNEMKSPEINYCSRFIRERNALAYVLENAKLQGILQIHTIHGDPKVNNIMIDQDTGKAISIVDLDTVRPGLIHYDIGDCLRSGCNTAGEDTRQWKDVHFDPDICKAILQGYISVAKAFLTERDVF
jgi:hypothetical protein